MLELAFRKSEELTERFRDVIDDDHFKWYFCGPQDIPQFAEGIICSRQYASVDKFGKVVGYINYDWSEVTLNCLNLGAINFTKEPNLTFSRDVQQVIYDIFVKYNFNSIHIGCVKSSPQFEMYKRMMDTTGGRYVGYTTKSEKLSDNLLYDFGLFEITKTGFLQSKIYKRMIKE